MFTPAPIHRAFTVICLGTALSGCGVSEVPPQSHARTATVEISADGVFRVTTDSVAKVYQLSSTEFVYSDGKIPGLSPKTHVTVVVDRDVANAVAILAMEHFLQLGYRQVEARQSAKGIETILVVAREGGHCSIQGFLGKESSPFPCSDLLNTLARDYPDRPNTNVRAVSFGNFSPELATSLESEARAAGYTSKKG